jgi:CheY-like chemotaxis protein
VRVHKILIVDDDKAMCNLLRACLSEGYEVFDTVDPEQALGLALEHKPDAIVFGPHDAEILRIRTMPELSLPELHVYDSDPCYHGRDGGKI